MLIIIIIIIRLKVLLFLLMSRDQMLLLSVRTCLTSCLILFYKYGPYDTVYIIVFCYRDHLLVVKLYHCVYLILQRNQVMILILILILILITGTALFAVGSEDCSISLVQIDNNSKGIANTCMYTRLNIVFYRY